MVTGSFRFERFVLDPHDRRLTCDGAPVELNARYLDALALLVREQGKLVPKERFLDEVWNGVPVTDEALTQCIRTLRRQLGDDAVRPRFIETVVKHGYRFVAPVEAVAETTPAMAETDGGWGETLRQGLAGTVGAGVAGLAGGLVYGFGAASQPVAAGTGAISILLVVVCLTVLIAVAGGAGVSFGIAVARRLRGHGALWSVLGGTIGGVGVGAVVKLLGLDAFNLLFGAAPAGITGAPEGAVLGASAGVAAWLALKVGGRRGQVLATVCGGAGGVAIALAGGRTMAGSLALLSAQFPASRLRLDPLWALLGEHGFGPVSQVVTAGLEGALFAGFIAGAMQFSVSRRG